MNIYLTLKSRKNKLEKTISAMEKRKILLEKNLRNCNVFLGADRIPSAKYESSGTINSYDSRIERTMEINATKLINEIEDLEVSLETKKVELVIVESDLEIYEIDIVSNLSPEEQQILQLIEEIQDMKKIAELTNSAKSTVYRHLAKIKGAFKNNDRNRSKRNMNVSKPKKNIKRELIIQST